MPAGTDAIAVKDSARAFAIETFGDNHDYVFVQHLDDKHPHVHLTVRSLGHDGKRLNPRKADLQAWRERFAGRASASRDRGGGHAAANPRTGSKGRSRRGAGLAQAKDYARGRSARPGGGASGGEGGQDCRTSLGRADQVTSGRDPAAISRLRGRAAAHWVQHAITSSHADPSIRQGHARVETRRHVLKKELLRSLPRAGVADAEQGVDANRRADRRGDERTR